MTAMVMTACTGQQSDTASQNSDKEFNYVVDQFADWRFFAIKFRVLSPCPCNKSNYYIIFPKRP